VPQLNDYHSILLDIAQKNPGGGVDLHKELARRFLAEGDAPRPPATLPIVHQNTIPPPSPQQDDGTQQINGVTGASDHPFVDYGSKEDVNQRLDKVSAEQGLDKPQGMVTSVPGEATVTAQPAIPLRHASTGGGTDRPSADQQLLNEGNQSIKDTATQTGLLGRAQGDLKDEAARNMQGALNDQQAYSAKLEAQKQQILQRQMALIEQSTGTIDPKKFWQGQDGYHRTMAGISLMLGALGGGLQGQGNTSPVVGLINQNIELQKNQFERDRNAANAYGDIYRNLTSDGLSHAQASETAVKMMQAISDKQVEAMAGKFAPALQSAGVGKELAGFGIDSGQKLAATHASLSQALSTNYEGQLKKLQLDQSKAWAGALEQMTGIKGAPAEGLVRDEHGNTGVSLRGAEGAKDYATQAMSAQKILQSIANIDAQRKKGTVLDKSALRSESEALKASVLELHGLKDNPKAQQMAEALVGDPAESFENPVTGGWTQKRQALIQMAHDRLRQAEGQDQVIFKGRPQGAVAD
jgi:hypothetical protein